MQNGWMANAIPMFGKAHKVPALAKQCTLRDSKWLKYGIGEKVLRPAIKRKSPPRESCLKVVFPEYESERSDIPYK